MESDGSPGLLSLLVVLVVAVVVYLFASLVEGALSALSRGRVQRLAEQSPAEARRISQFVERPAVHLATASVIKLAALAAGAVAVVQLLLMVRLASASFLAWVILLVGSLVLGWVLPRSLAARSPERVMVGLGLPFQMLSWIFAPLAGLVAGATSGLAQLFGAEAIPEGPIVTPAELKVMVAASEEEGLIEQDERAMIDNILELEGKSVREVMVPRPDMVALPNTTTARQAMETLKQEGYSRLPVYQETIDNVVGVLYGKDLFSVVLDNRLDARIGELVRPAYFVPESKKTDDLLRELQQSRIHIAIVVDEYGGTSGLVTIEDLLEEIVGEIQDEYDVEEQKIVLDGQDSAVVDGAVSIDDVNEVLGLDLEAEEVDTIGGLVFERLGRVPIVGDHVQIDHALLTVTASHGRRVTRVKVERQEAPPANGAASASQPQPAD